MKTIIVRCELNLKLEELRHLAGELAIQNKNGCVVLPPYCKLIYTGESTPITVCEQNTSSTE